MASLMSFIVFLSPSDFDTEAVKHACNRDMRLDDTDADGGWAKVF